MRAVLIDGYGGPEVLRVGEAPQPRPGPGQVLVRTVAAGVNPIDWKIREGYMQRAFDLPFPAVMGAELAGVVEALGADVTAFAAGDEVHGMVGSVGCYADYAAMNVANLARKPASMTWATAAALPVAAGTSVAALKLGDVGPGTRVLVHAASGGVGHVLVQLARRAGAEVTALGSPGNLAFLTELGAAHVVDRTTAYEQTLGGFDVVIDAVGPPAQARSWSLLRKGGILVSFVARIDQEAAAAHEVRAVTVGADRTGAALAEIDALVERGEVKVLVSRTYPLEQAPEAIAEVQRGQVRGKLVLTFD